MVLMKWKPEVLLDMRSQADFIRCGVRVKALVVTNFIHIMSRYGSVCQARASYLHLLYYIYISVSYLATGLFQVANDN